MCQSEPHPLRRVIRAVHGATPLSPHALSSSALIALLFAACAPAGTSVPRPQRVSLLAVVDSVVTSYPLDGARWGIAVYDADNGWPVVRRDAERRLVPASNQKLVTAAVALAELGPEYRFRTDFLVRGVSAAGVAGDLMIVGRGDPSLSVRFHGSDRTALEELADSIALLGVRRVEGDLIVDASYFEGAAVHGSWEVGDLDWYYAAPVAAFAVGEATVHVVIEPGGEAGEPVLARVLEPRGPVTVENRLRAGDVTARTLRRLPEAHVVVLEGTVQGSAPPDTLRSASAEPAFHAAVALRDLLHERGIFVGGRIRVLYDRADAASARARMGWVRLFTWSSPPLSEIVGVMMPHTQNWIAEQIFLTLGAERGQAGSWAGGTAATRRYLSSVVGLDSLAFVVRDGSGLSRHNLITAASLVEILEHAREQPWGADFRHALAQPGQPGTLAGRLEGLEGRMQAKTGTMTHVNALSGYLRTSDGREVSFSVVVNATGQPAASSRAAIDRIVTAMDQGGFR